MPRDLQTAVRRLMMIIPLVLIAAGSHKTTAAGDDAARSLLLLPNPSDALDPRNPPFKAIPNDGQDDRDKLQQWIDAGCNSASKLLYLPPGDWNVTRRPLVGATNIGSLQITCDGLTILGAGRASRIVMQGSAVLPANFRAPARLVCVRDPREKRYN